MIEYEPYHVHTCYSNCLTQPDSTMFIKDYAKAYRERGHKVLCISEHGNRSNVWEQFDICESYKKDGYEMKPLAAAECYFVPDRKAEIEGHKDGRNFHLILVAKDMEGFYQLNEAISEANLTGFYNKARVDFDILGRLDYRHFICTTACVAGILKDDECEKYAWQLHEIFRENFYLEVQHHAQQIQIDTNLKALRLYNKYHWPLIYGTDSHYINKEDKILRTELLLSAGISYGDEDSFDLYLPTGEEAYNLLLNQGVMGKARIEEALENTLIFRECEGVHFTNEKKIPNVYPDMPVEQRNKMYKKLVCYGYIDRAGMPNKEEAAEIHAEMDTITDTNTADYFLLNKRIVELGKEYGGVLTTTGRGSAASFACNYAFGFTSINRLHCPVKMLPERFVSADRLKVSLPDIDMNMAGVEAFERAGKELLGEYGCLPMIAFGTVKTLSAFKLMARARNLDFETANEVSKQIAAYERDVKHAIENNSDDPDYDVDDDVQIENYVEDQYLGLIEDSKQYKGIVTSLSPHPCAHILLDKDLRRETGIIRVKAKTGNKDAVYAAYIDGRTADSYNYVKADFLRVDVVRIISETFAAIGQPVMTVDELLEKVKDNEKVWSLYWDGFTMGLNQVEREKSTERCMRYRPTCVEELAAFIAGIRPGFKSMLETFISRTRFEYGIPSLDNLLKTKAIPDSFLEYDEQLLVILKAAGIPGPDAYAAIKAIKKKKADKVASYKERFKEGFAKYLMETENASPEKAQEVVGQIWTIMENAANYLFCAAHAFSMACDSLYVAWLKAYYPYELYVTMLKIYDEKKRKDKIAQIIREMKKYKGIKLISGRFGQDNRDWLIDREHATISQSLSSIRYVNKMAADELYELGKQTTTQLGVDIHPAVFVPEVKKRISAIKKRLKALKEQYETSPTDAVVEEGQKLETEMKELIENDSSYVSRLEEVPAIGDLGSFTNLLRAIQMNTDINIRVVKVLISLNYFRKYGKCGKLMKVYDEFVEGENAPSKTVKSFKERLDKIREFEASLPDESLPISLRLKEEYDNIGLCLSVDPLAPSNYYFVQEVDDKYSIRIKLYGARIGNSGVVRISKKQQESNPLQPGLCIVGEFEKRDKFTYKGGKRTQIPGKEVWLKEYVITP